jgi:hypothetical protein
MAIRSRRTWRSVYTGRSVAGGEGAFPGSWVEGTANWAAKWIFLMKNFTFCAQRILNYWAAYKEIQQTIVILFTFITSVRGGYCDYWPGAPKNLATPLYTGTTPDVCKWRMDMEVVMAYFMVQISEFSWKHNHENSQKNRSQHNRITELPDKKQDC